MWHSELYVQINEIMGKTDSRLKMADHNTENGDCSHEIKRRSLLERKVMTNLDSILKSREWEEGSGWGIHVYPRLIHVNVWQKPLQYCKVISLQPIKMNGKKKKQRHYFPIKVCLVKAIFQ